MADLASLQATVIRGLPSFHARYSMKRVLPHPVGPFSIIGMRTEYAASNRAISSASGQ